MTITPERPRYGIRIDGVAGFVRHRFPDARVGQWVKAYDPDAHDGGGWLVTTDHTADALLFPDIAQAAEFWRQQSLARPFRDDGLPNRPLTALSVIFEEIPL